MRAVKHALMRMIGKRPVVRVVLTVEPANGARFAEVTNLVIALLKESGSGDETDTFVNPKLVSAHEEFE